LYYSDPNLTAAHLAAPWVVIPDNHDFANLPGEPAPPGATDEEVAALRRFGGAEVFWEWTPTRPVVPDGSGDPHPSPGRNRQVSNPTGPDVRFTYKVMRWGRRLSLISLTWNHLRGVGEPDPDDPFGPAPAFLGDLQWAWLKRVLADEAGATHRIILNQKNMSQLGNVTLPSDLVAAGRELGIPADEGRDAADIYPGWTADRRTLYAYLRQIGVVDNIVLTGDSHGWWAYDLVEDSTFPDYNPVDPWAGTRTTPVGIEVVVGMGRPGLADVAAELAAEAALGGGEAHSAFGAGAVYRTAFRPPAEVASRVVEAAAMAANPNMAYMNWREYGHVMVHLYADRSVVELLASPQDQNLGPGERRSTLGLVDQPADTVLRRYESAVGRPHLSPLPVTTRTSGQPKPSLPSASRRSLR
jgi:alkaline phosphatase D